MRRRSVPMRSRPNFIRNDAQWPYDDGGLSDWAWTKRDNADAVRVVLNRRTGIRHRIVRDEDYALWFIEVGS